MPRTDLLIKGTTIITPELALGGGAVGVSGGRISFVGPVSEAPEAERSLDCAGGYLLPGFVDLHCHGGGGYDTSAGKYDADGDGFVNDPDVLRTGVGIIAETHLRHGTTSIALATCAAEEPRLLRALAAVGMAAEEGKSSSRLLGVNLEGCYIKDSAFAGAQNPEFFRRPDSSDFDRLNEAARGRIAIVNVTADWGQPAVKLVAHLVSKGVVAACGHSGGDYAEMKACIDAGTSLAVHYSNGPCSTSYKPPGKVMEALLEDGRVTLELIADGYHINPAYLLSFLKAKSLRAVLITDAMLPVDARGLNSFTVTGMTGEKTADGGVLRLLGTEDTLFGSLLTMDRAVANLTGWLSGGAPGMFQNAPIIDPPPCREEALVLASCLASGYPAEVIGGRSEFGAIETGLSADMVFMNEELEVERVWVSGREV